jgi:hypothetical protein
MLVAQNTVDSKDRTIANGDAPCTILLGVRWLVLDGSTPKELFSWDVPRYDKLIPVISAVCRVSARTATRYRPP